MATAATAVAIVVGGGAAVVALHGAPHPSAGHGTAPAHGATGGSAAPTEPAPPPPQPLRVESIGPAGGAQDVSFAPTVTIQLSAPLATGSPLPTLTPAIAGSWSAATDDTLVFHPDADFSPYTTVHVTIPGGAGGLRDAGGATLPSTVSSSFTVEGGSLLRLQQLLAELGYLPVSFVREGAGGTASATTTAVLAGGATGTTGTSSPSGPSASGGNADGTSAPAQAAPAGPPAIDAEATAADEVQLTPVSGRFAWRYADTPALLEQQWTAGQYNEITRGAIMAFEAASGLAVDGEAGPAVWHALLAAVAARQVDPTPYVYITVSESLPETLTVWQGGKDVLSFLANTGIPAAPTAQGTFTVYARYAVTTMSGKNPNGTKYSDPGIPWVAYFNGGDAIHGFIRYSYGFPQSLGCVELPYADAHQVWPYDQLGTLVTVY